MLETIGFIGIGVMLTIVSTQLWRAFQYWRESADLRLQAYNEGFDDGEAHALQARGYDPEREAKEGRRLAELHREAEEQNRPSGVAGNA